MNMMMMTTTTTMTSRAMEMAALRIGGGGRPDRLRRDRRHPRLAAPPHGVKCATVCSVEKQLGTARLPAGLNTEQFKMQMFQWATTISTSGQNLPLALPLKVDRTDKGFTMSLIRIDSMNTPVSVADITAEVEDIGSGQQAFVISLAQEKEEILVDLDLIMESMKMAIVRAVKMIQAAAKEQGGQ